MTKLNGFSGLDSETVLKAREGFGTPLYIYDERHITEKCKAALAMPNAYGLTVRYAMKANSNRTVLKIIEDQGLLFDASSLNEVRRARLAGIDCRKIMLTTQEVPSGCDRDELQDMIKSGLKYNVCSIRQLHLIGDFAAENGVELSIRVHPGVGSGESNTRNTGDNYSCFGVHLSDIDEAVGYARAKGIKFRQVHTHIGSGGDPEMWRQNIDLELDIIDRHFPDAVSVSFGGGLKEARMPDEDAADIEQLGLYAKKRVEEFFLRTGRRLEMEIEPGTYIVANSGYAVLSVSDKKRTGAQGMNFIIADGGMNINARPLLYGSRHPFYVIGKDGSLLSSEFTSVQSGGYEAALVGHCCESGDSQVLDAEGHNIPRRMVEPDFGDTFVIGGVGAYCSSMTPSNYNSHLQAPEVLFSSPGELKLIRKRQTMEQLLENEI